MSRLLSTSILGLLAITAVGDNLPSAAEIGSILQEVDPVLGHDVKPEQAGRFVGGTEGKRFRITRPAVFMQGEAKWLAFVVGELQTPSSAIDARLGASTVPSLGTPARLVIGRRLAPHGSKSVVLDARALASPGGIVEVGDFVGDGSQQALVRAMLLYGEDNPRRFIETERMFLFSLPDLRKLAEVTEKWLSRNESGMELRRKTVEFVQRGETAARVLVVTDLESGEVSESVLTGHGYALSDADEITRDKERKTISVEESEQKDVTFRVVNKRATPVANATFVAMESISDFLGLDSKVVDHTMKTGLDGSVRLSVKGALDISIHAQGYEPFRNTWDPSELSPEPIVIALDDRESGVPMRTSLLCPTYRESMSRLTFGIDLNPSVLDSDNAMTSDHTRAGIWVELVRTGPPAPAELAGAKRVEYNTRQWHVKVSGLNGWEVCMGPVNVTSNHDPRLRVAPDEGYTDELEFTASDVPIAIFLRYGQGKRFGVISQFAFRDDCKINRPLYFVWANHSVQTTETGSRSLLPDDRP